MLKNLKKNFDSRSKLINYISTISPWLDNFTASEILGGRNQAKEKLAKIDPIKYCRNRNYLDGSVTKLSPYIRHGILSLNEVRNLALEKAEAKQIEKFIQELAWRDFWQRIYFSDPSKIWHDIEEYKTGYQKEDYANDLTQDILEARTPNACINQFINQLIKTGYLHNHTRMYLASYIVHWRKIKWQVGAKWFLHHLLDGDPASNNLSWQWVASTFSNKPYIFNLENVAKYCGNSEIDVSKKNNPELNFSYEELEKTLFKKLPVCPFDIREGVPRNAGRDSCRVSVSRRDKRQKL